MDTQTRELMFSSENVEWGTPQDVYDQRNLLHQFDLDVCASELNHKHSNYISEQEDAFITPWEVAGPDGMQKARCWMNPPYRRAERLCKNPDTCKKKRCKTRGHHCAVNIPGLYDWLQLAWKKSHEGCLVDCLLPARTGTRWWRDFVWDNDNGRARPGVHIFFIEGRLQFEGAPASAPFDSVLVTFSPQ